MHCDLKALCASSEGDSVWWLAGVPWIPSTIVSAIRCLHFGKNGDPDFASEADALGTILPGGMEVLGALLVSQVAPSNSKAIETSKRIRSHFKNVKTELIGATGSIQSEQVDLYTESLSRIEVTEDGSEEFWDKTRLLHSHVELNVPSSGDKQGVNQFSQKYLLSSRIAFVVEYAGMKMLVKPNTVERLEAFPGATKNRDLLPNPLDVRVFIQQCANKDDQVVAPVIQYVPGEMSYRKLKLNLDVVCLVSANSTLAEATSQVQRSLCSQLEFFGKTLATKSAGLKLRSYHFVVPGFVHPVTAIYDENQSESDAELVNLRKSLHLRLRLPLDRPLVRAANALTIRKSEIVWTQNEGGRRLLNVHNGIPRCGISGGEMSVIQGSYEYYHYLQDRCDDNGWGCAYRSLQTIISWFKLQHYTTVAVPSHKEIQQTLVDIGDKEASFVGSREWIGAIELSFVLDKLLGVTSKILNVRSGTDLPEKCRELAAHFDTQGTPVMIGGGVLAYTLLGVDYNERTGECAFFILDPHYTGGEDLKAIRNGGWCGWKRAVNESGKEFFLRNKFYNLLLPQRPQTV